MKLIDKRTDPLLYSLAAVLVVLTFISDLFFPLGTAIWVVYLLPVALCYLGSRPEVPLVVAAVTSVLVLIGYFSAPVGVDPDFARINRVLGVLTTWILAGAGYFFIANKLAIQKHEWLQGGQVGLSQNIGGNQRLEELCQNALAFLAEYLDAQAGALYVRDGLDFHRRAVYAVPENAPIADRFAPGDGLLGQAVRDKRSFLLNDVPDDYLYFGSGLGRSKPRSLLIAPASVDGDINTVLELGFLDKASDEVVELLQSVSESIAIAVRSAQHRARLRELLEETQRQAEELQAQSEELRSTNEELESQSRSLQESQARLEQQQAELEQTNAQLEEQTQALEHQRDELTRAQAVLQQQAHDLEEASRYKSEFLASMSHELRTPLNSLLIMARLLAENRDGNLTADQVIYAQTIETAGNDLLALINDILDISKIEAGHIELQIESVRIDQMLEKLRASFQAPAAEKGLDFRIEITPGTPDELETDPLRLEQVLKNFLSNAIKFTDKGEVALSISIRKDEQLAFTVRDTGIGIAEHHREAIFEAFRQADGAIDRKYGGTGLGLSISSELSKLLGGQIELESEEGRGSAFTLVVPAVYQGDAAELPSNAASAVADTGYRHQAARTTGRNGAPAQPRSFEDDRDRLTTGPVILVVEDDLAFAQILVDLAHELGFQCLVAETADEGVLLARQYLPSGVILDIGLPDHTGLSVLDRLKHDTRTRHIPVHVVSVSDYMHTALSFGAVGYMLKPVKREELEHALRNLTARLTPSLRRVLIVEDDAAQLEALQLLLSSQNVETVAAASAAECLEKLKAETFDCMVLDLSLPDATGFEVLEQLSVDEAYAFPPTIVYTGRELTPDEELGLRKFSSSIIIKGAKSPERLLDEVTLFLHQMVSELPEQKREMLARSLNRDAALEGRCILVVEDDIRNVYALMSIFETHGARVEIARNGREALQALKRAANGSSPAIDLVLMDVMMPEMDGLTATREIRKLKEWKGLPIIMLTAKAMPGDQEQCLAAGANDYLAKPLDVDKLLSLARVWIPR
ncbi:response regulator [Chelativorans sp. Marseille-P2723]|uniref:response regulator n=1 Tax=Chelativorans sp. Marseille-P2723 TaxID=2709133 RepID=UPI00157059A2|nr:response regulator [Chelativorans sp. Marseille-P2723]